MKIKAIRVDRILAGADEGDVREYVVGIEIDIQTANNSAPLTIKMIADVPHDPSLTYDQIANAGLRRAREIISLLAGSDDEAWHL